MVKLLCGMVWSEVNGLWIVLNGVRYMDRVYIGELDDKELVSVLKKMREDIEVMRRVLKNVEEIEEMYYEEYLKRGKKEE